MARKQPVQQQLFKPRGGKRRGAGRPPKGARAGAPHKQRPFLHARYSVHVTLRAIAAVGNLRRRSVYQAIQEATLTTARREDFRIVQLSIQHNHVHLIVEADDKRALAAGMQGFQISAAKHLNAAISKGRPGPRRRGTVFPDRYHAEIITSPTQARHALSYVVMTGGSTARIRADRRRRGSSTGSRARSRSPAGPNMATRRSCGAARRPTIRSWFISQERGCSGKVGRSLGRSRAARCRRSGDERGDSGDDRRAALRSARRARR
jgi:REP element-mobilizing transposase RayT